MNKVTDLSIKTPIDKTKAIQLLGGSEANFFNFLSKLEPLSLMPMMAAIKDAVEAKDFYTYKEKAHSLKGASGYVGASHIMYSCYHI